MSTLQDELAALVTIIREDRGEARVKALATTMDMALAKDDRRKVMGDSSLELLPALVSAIVEDKGEARVNALGTTWGLSRDNGNKKVMGDSSLGLFSALVSVIHEDKGEARVNALSTLQNLSVDIDNNKVMGVSSLGLLSALVSVIREDKGEARKKALAATRNLSVLLENADTFVQMDLHGRLFDVLNDPTVDGDSRDYLMTATMVYCRYPPAARAFRTITGVVDAVSLLTGETGANGLKATFILSQLVGRDESNSKANTQSLLQSRPATLDQLVDVLENNIALRNGADYELGIFDLNAVTSAVLSLCTSDANKSVMVKSRRLLELLVQLLQSFIDNNPQYEKEGIGRGGVGGGGKDIETATYVTHSLLQLSFYYPDDRLLVSVYMTADLNLVDLLQQLLNLPAERQLESYTMQCASNLLMRLLCRLDLAENFVSTAKHQHVMLSYAWGAKKQLVINFQTELQQLGYDVWRDEDGSSIVPAMSGAVDDRMAEAIEASYAVIICVSPQYKESANCQMEAKYSNVLYKKKKLSIHYVMMDSNYHTNSDPVCVDGWLAFMIGGALWYPLWDESSVGNTAAYIGTLLGNNAKIVTSAPTTPSKQSPSIIMKSATNTVSFSPALTPSTDKIRSKSEASIATVHASTLVSGGAVKRSTGSVQVTPVSGGRRMPAVEVNERDSSIDTAWEILINPHHSLDHSRLDNSISGLGVTSPELLEYLDERETLELANLLKPVPRRAFMSQLIWRVLTEHGSDSDQLASKLNELGIRKASQLTYLDDEQDISDVFQSLKKVPAKQFFTKMPRS